MAARRLWLVRVPEIRQDVQALEVPVVDRVLFEKLFHVRRRRALELMHVFGGYQTGQAFLIDRAELVRQLEALEAGTEFAMEQGRRRRLLDSLREGPPTPVGGRGAHSGRGSDRRAEYHQPATRSLSAGRQPARRFRRRRGPVG